MGFSTSSWSRRLWIVSGTYLFVWNHLNSTILRTPDLSLHLQIPMFSGSADTDCNSAFIRAITQSSSSMTAQGLTWMSLCLNINPNNSISSHNFLAFLSSILKNRPIVVLKPQWVTNFGIHLSKKNTRTDYKPGSRCGDLPEMCQLVLMCGAAHSPSQARQDKMYG